MRRLGDQTGLIGKLIALWLVLVALVVVLAVDAGSVLLARVRTADLAQEVAFEGARTLERTGDPEAARDAALARIERSGSDARLKRFDAEGSEVTVVLTDRTGTILLGRLPFTSSLTRVVATDTAHSTED